MVQTLFQLALATCVQNAGLIDDVGSTPYHIVRPILRRLNAKQLSTVESNSPLVTPDSDELWQTLIEKDFPDRALPNPSKRGLIADSGEKMPTKALYDQYVNEREQLRASSAQRLRNFNQRLQKEKSRNMIVPLKGIVHEPMRRRIAQPFQPYNRGAPRSRTILGKAMRDIQHRLLIFLGGTRHDPYRVFERQKLEREKVERQNLEREKLERQKLDQAKIRRERARSSQNSESSLSAGPSPLSGPRPTPRPATSSNRQEVSRLPWRGATDSRSVSSIRESVPGWIGLGSRERRTGRYDHFSPAPSSSASSDLSRTPQVPTSRSLANSALYQYKRPDDSRSPERAGSRQAGSPPAPPIEQRPPPPIEQLPPSPPPRSPADPSLAETAGVAELVDTRKRKAPSIFLPKRKIPRAPRITIPKARVEELESKAIRAKPALRSSIFH